MSPLRRVMWSSVALGLVACARVPQESVELSVTLGRDLAEAHRANRALASQYFSRMYADVDAFVDRTYRPYLIRSAMESLDLVNLVRASIGSDTLDPLDIMEIFAEETIVRIMTFRAELRQPIERQELEVLQAIDDAYQRMQNANAIITGHLASVRKVHDAQAEFLAGVGLGDLRAQVSERVAAMSDSLRGLLDGATRVRELVDRGEERLSELGATLEALPARVRAVSGDSTGVARPRRDRPPPGGRHE